jgi:hypothetical protein
MQIDEVYRIAFEAFTNALDQKLTTPAMDVSIAPKYRHGTLLIKPQDVFSRKSSPSAIIFASLSKKSTLRS